MPNEVANHKNNANESVKDKNNYRRWWVISTKTMQMRLLSTRTMPNEVAKHKNNDRRGCRAQEQFK